MAATESYVRNQLYSIPLAELLPDPNQPRKFLDPAALEELTVSIAQHGVLESILFQAEDGLNYIVAGERRCLAARQAGLVAIPTIFINSQNHAEIALVENLLRQDLNPVEEAEGFVATLATTEDEIADLDLESLSALEKNNVIKAVDSLRQTINAFFGQVGQ